MLLVLLGGGWYLYTTYLGGSGSVSAPTNTPDLPDVDLPGPGEAVGDGAEAAESGAKKAADEIAGLPPVFWTTVLPVAVGVMCVWWIWKDPKRRSIALGVALVCLVVFLIGRSG
jgi:hypothetical protein